MKNHNFFRNAALAFGLLAAGSSFAAETSVPAAKAPEQREAVSSEIRSEMANKTPEQRAAFRAETKAKMDKMTPEQRAEMQGKMHGAMADHDAKGEGHEHGAMRHEHMHTGDMHAAGGMHAR